MRDVQNTLNERHVRTKIFAICLYVARYRLWERISGVYMCWIGVHHADLLMANAARVG